MEDHVHEDIKDCFAAYIGDHNQQYYLDHFSQFYNDKLGPEFKASWNWSAFFASGLWALYRKLYGLFFAYWGALVIISIVGKVAPILSLLMSIIASIAFATYANSLYFISTNKKIAYAKHITDNRQSLLNYLSSKGGVNAWVFVLALVPLVGIFAAIIIPQFNKNKTNNYPQYIGDSNYSQNQVSYENKYITPSESRATKQVKIVVTDNCNDYESIMYRFYDNNGKQLYPETYNSVYTTQQYGKPQEHIISCNQNEVICYGAAPNSSTRNFEWGYGIDNPTLSQATSNCITCGLEETKQVNLTCPEKSYNIQIDSSQSLTVDHNKSNKSKQLSNNLKPVKPAVNSTDLTVQNLMYCEVMRNTGLELKIIFEENNQLQAFDIWHDDFKKRCRNKSFDQNDYILAKSLIEGKYDYKSKARSIYSSLAN